MTAPHRTETPARQDLSSRQPPHLVAGRLGVVFVWHEDRWLHRIVRADSVVLESVEGPFPGAGDPRWPASPVLTEVSTVETAGGIALLGVGRAGRSHFSASITADRLRPDTLVFDIACRIQETPGWLGSTYRRPDDPAGGPRIAAPTDAAGPLPRTVVWNYAIGPDGLLPPSAAAEGPHGGT